MALSHFSYLYGVVDAKIFPLTADPAGGSPTYTTGIDVPGVKSLSISGDMATKSLRGDNTLLANFTTLQNVTAQLDYARSDFDIMATVLGGTVVDSGSGSTEVSTFTLSSPDELGEFKIEAVAAKSDQVIGDLHIILHKCVATGFPFAGLAEEDFAIQSLGVTCAPLLSTGNTWVTVKINETAVAISA